MNRQAFLLLLSGLLIGIAIGIAFFFGFNRGDFLAIDAPPDSSAPNSDPLGTSIYAPEKGSFAPEFELESLSGDPVSITSFRGKAVLLNFWATWCGPCRVEMPALQARHEQFGDKLAVIAIDFDEPKDAVQAFADELGLTFTMLLDPGGEVQNVYRVRGYPTSVFLDENGVVQIVHIGIMSDDQLDAYLQELGVFE